MDTIICATFQKFHSKFNSPLSSIDFSVCMTLTERRRFHAAVQVYRVLHKLSPSHINDIFHYAIDITSFTGQNLCHLFVPRVQTTLAIVFISGEHKSGIH